jgi:hypothetical protein
MNQCLDLALKTGKITRSLGDRLKAYDNIDQAIEAETLNLAKAKRDAAIQAVRVSDGWEKVKSHKKGVYYGLMALMARDKKEMAGYGNIDKLAQAYEHRYHSRFSDALAAFRTKGFGLTQDRDGLVKLVKSIFGEVVDDPEINKFAKQWHELGDEIRQDFNARGGSISKNEKWLMPQIHDAKALTDAGLDRWKADIKPQLDRTQMVDDLGKPLNDTEIDEALDYVFETITTHGLNKMKELTPPRLGRKLSKKGADRRFLYFKDADSWINYNKEYGKGNIFTTLTDHIQSKAHDIAMLETMGPSPESTFKTLKAMAEREGLSGPQKTSLNALWNVVSGKVNSGELMVAAEIGQSTRNVLTASTLGAAFLSAISDIGFQFIASKTNKIPFYKVMSTMVKQLNPANESDRLLAARIGLGLEEWTNLASSANRWSDVYGTSGTAKVADFVMRASFLAQWTDAGRKAFGMEFSAKLAENFDKKLDSLDDGLKEAFKRYGIDEKLWDEFRKTKPITKNKAKFADLTQKGGVKFHQMIISETDFAVPVPDANTRAITTGGKERASVTGQLVRTLTNLKSFPITIVQTHLYRLANQEGMGKLQYAGLLLAVSTVMGGLALQLKDVASGRTPRETGFEDKDPKKMRKFIGAAIAQGGGLGIFGDYLFSDVNRFGIGPISSPFGPSGELATKTGLLTLGNLQQFLAGDETNIVPEALQYLKRYTPDVWQTRLLTDSMFDQLTIMADSRFEKKFRRQMRKRQKDYSQDYWWKKGKTLPEFVK